MIEEYDTWEDGIRRTFIELADLQMNQYSDPIEFAIDFAWANGCDLFTINNAKDQLKKLKRQTSDTSSNNEAIDQLLSMCETAINTGRWHLTPSLVYNAKDNLNQLRKAKKDLAIEAYKANQFAAEQTNLYLSASNTINR